MTAGASSRWLRSDSSGLPNVAGKILVDGRGRVFGKKGDALFDGATGRRGCTQNGDWSRVRFDDYFHTSTHAGQKRREIAGGLGFRDVNRRHRQNHTLPVRGLAWILPVHSSDGQGVNKKNNEAAAYGRSRCPRRVAVEKPAGTSHASMDPGRPAKLRAGCGFFAILRGPGEGRLRRWKRAGGTGFLSAIRTSRLHPGSGAP